MQYIGAVFIGAGTAIMQTRPDGLIGLLGAALWMLGLLKLGDDRWGKRDA